MSKHHLPGYNDDDIIDLTIDDQGDTPSLIFKKQSITPDNDPIKAHPIIKSIPYKAPLAELGIPLAFMAPTAMTIPVDSPAKTNAKTKHYSCVFGDETGTRAGCDCHYDITSNNAGWFDAKLKNMDNFTAFSKIQIPDCSYDPTLFNEAAGLMRQITGYDSGHSFSTVN